MYIIIEIQLKIPNIQIHLKFYLVKILIGNQIVKH